MNIIVKLMQSKDLLKKLIVSMDLSITVVSGGPHTAFRFVPW